MLSEGSDPTNILYYGDGGMGKTTNIAAMARLGPIVLINAESGIKRRALIERDIPVENIQVFPGDDEEISYAGLEALWVELREQLHKDPGSIVGVGWDSITEIQKALGEIERVKAIGRAAARGTERGEFVMDQDNRTTVNEQMRSLIRKYRDLPCHFALTALQRREVDEVDASVTYQPGVTPGLQGDLIGYMDLVCHCSVTKIGGEEEFLGLFRPEGKFRGKDRLGNRTPRFLVDPTFDRVLPYTDGDMTVEQDPVMKAAKKRRDDAAKAEAAAS